MKRCLRKLCFALLCFSQQLAPWQYVVLGDEVRGTNLDPQRGGGYFVRERARLPMQHLDDARDDLKKAVQVMSPLKG